jgi:nucleoredoxin
MALASLQDLVGDKLVTASGEEISTSSLNAPLYGIYFSAEWCPPCRAFTPNLVDFQKANEGNFQVIFVSFDRTAEAQEKYMTGYKMPWPAIPFGAEQGKALAEKFRVRGIPSLIILNAEGKLVSTDGRAEVLGNPSGAISEWSEKAP